jgi:hypothetical protein
MELQKKIANAKNMDYDTVEAIKKLLEQGPKEVKRDLVDVRVSPSRTPVGSEWTLAAGT